MSKILQNKVLLSQVVALLHNARQQVLRSVNATMAYTYFEIGRMIVEEEQKGKERAAYGRQVIKGLSEVLTKEFGKGFSIRNLEQIRKFYQIYSNDSAFPTILDNTIPQTLSAKSENIFSGFSQTNLKLSWSHYSLLIRIENEKESKFYEMESENANVCELL